MLSVQAWNQLCFSGRLVCFGGQKTNLVSGLPFFHVRAPCVFRANCVHGGASTCNLVPKTLNIKG